MSAKIFWAKTRDGQVRSVIQVESGLDCDCVCSFCGTDLEAINPRNLGKVRPHFRHRALPETGACSDAAIRLGLRQALQTLPRIHLPQHGFTRSETPAIRGVQFKDETLAVLELEDGRKLLLWLSATGTPTNDESAKDGVLRLDVSRIGGGQDVGDLVAALQAGRLHLDWITHWKDAIDARPVYERISPPSRTAAPRPRTASISQGDRLEVVVSQFMRIYPAQGQQWHAVASHIRQAKAAGRPLVPKEIARAANLSTPTVETFLKSLGQR
jgi:hypothetical protein